MEPDVEVHERVCRKRKELSETDVLVAWNGRIKCQLRVGPWPSQYVAAGFDSKGRVLQMVAVYDSMQDLVLIFHAMPLTGNVKRELGLD